MINFFNVCSQKDADDLIQAVALILAFLLLRRAWRK